MVQVYGNATTGTNYDNVPHPDLPRDTAGIRPAHKPWCVDCKRKDRELDADQRCAQCARAAITRAAAAERRAAEEAARVAAEKAAKIATTAATTELPTEGKRGQPTTRTSAPRATTTSGTSGRAPDAGPSTHREKNPPAAQETRPAAAGSPSTLVENRATAPTPEQVLDAQVEHAANLLRATHAHPDPAVQATRAAAVAVLESLHLVHVLAAPPAPAPTPAAQAAPAPVARRVRRAGHRIATSRPLDETAIVAEYRAGDSTPTVATRHATNPARIRAILRSHGVPLRDDRGRNGGHNRFSPTPEQLAELRRRYVDDQVTIAQLADEHGIHRRIIARVLTDAGVTIRPPAHQRNTTLTPEQTNALIEAYRSGTPLYRVAARFHIRVQTARQLVTDAGLPLRAKGASTQIADRLADLGVTARQVKEWAHAEGHIDRVTTGLVPGWLIDKYAAAHPAQINEADQVDVA